jgi:hypothetical protein
MTYDVKREVKECDTEVNKRTDRSACPSKYFSSFDNASVSIAISDSDAGPINNSVP